MKHDPPPDVTGDGEGWFKTPVQLLEALTAGKISVRDTAVALVLLRHRGNKSMLAWPSGKTISHICGICLRSTRESIASLSSAGLISVRRRKQQNALYDLAPLFNNQEVHVDALQEAQEVHPAALQDTLNPSRSAFQSTQEVQQGAPRTRLSELDVPEVQENSTAVVSTVQQIFDSLPGEQRQAALILQDWSLWKLQPIKTKGRIEFDAQTYPALNLALCAQNMVDYYNSQDGKNKNGHAVNGPLTWGKWLAREAERQPAQAQANNGRDEIEQEAIRQTLAFREMHERETAELRGKAS